MVDAYRRHLAGLPEEGFLLPRVARRLCLLTGQSCFRSSLLPADKHDFLAAVASAGVEVVQAGFPWHRQFTVPAPPPPLVVASLRNAQQWLWARSDAAYQAALAAVIGMLLDRTHERLFLVTGSCGIDLLATVLPRLPLGPEIHVAALGPAGRSPPVDRLSGLLVLQGRRDGWSRHLWRGVVHANPDCGHLDYYRNRDAMAMTRAFLEKANR
ncbi:hypothetical protein [Nitrospirillum viridazoti]|uniref:Alpha/beta hydrolase n=1 Tax=Nitrospirillum viridazoti CBAmc TaxID=1441467 RepID=A0A248K2V2_9PROT|nr:hypothetical protein [Nitrospirillum amazonense]ASG25051.1 hypothetical protein Y958_29195 [Nitrospirillum amazonense CBAmc]TWB31195.1 hypothetical protein FBZ91_1203 [Nitrospirillum amazonense]